MTKARRRERKRPQAEFVTDEEQRLLEIEDMRLVVKFGDKKRYSNSEYEAIYQELVAAGLDDEARRDPDAIEAVFRKLTAVDEAEAASLVAPWRGLHASHVVAKIKAARWSKQHRCCLHSAISGVLAQSRRRLALVVEESL
jgi:hypothetical protein